MNSHDINKTRPWGRESCDACGGRCSGHYVTDIASLLALRKQGRALRSPPPSTIIEDAFKEGDATNNVDKLAKNCCLTSEEVQIWLDHLQKKKINRAKAAKKAAETLARKQAQLATQDN